MSEALAYTDDHEPNPVLGPDLYVVPEIASGSVIIPPECDTTGRVVRPAIELEGSTGRTPNGQPLLQFYLRGSIDYETAEYRAARALAEAKRLAKPSA